MTGILGSAIIVGGIVLVLQLLNAAKPMFQSEHANSVDTMMGLYKHRYITPGYTWEAPREFVEQRVDGTFQQGIR